MVRGRVFSPVSAVRGDFFQATDVSVLVMCHSVGAEPRRLRVRSLNIKHKNIFSGAPHSGGSGSPVPTCTFQNKSRTCQLTNFRARRGLALLCPIFTEQSERWARPTFGTRSPESSANWHPHKVSSCAGEEHKEGLGNNPRSAGGQASTSSR